MKQEKSILDFLQFSRPTEEQKDTLLRIETFINPENKEDFFILAGAAGTGKTSIATSLIGLLNNQSINYKIAAPTGRAARILGRKAKTLNSTIHSLIYTANPDPKTGEIILNRKRNEVKDFIIFIIDEASMIQSVAIRSTYGHSITCHKAQGGEWNKVLLNTFYMPSLRYTYTAITRAKSQLVLF